MSEHTLYDRLAPHYRDISSRRATYLAAVDALILERARRPGPAFLDVGAADGVRGLGLAGMLGASRVVFCEPSREMAAKCRQGAPRTVVWECAAGDMPLDGGPFDNIVCLWNVLGHMPDTAARTAALARMGDLLGPGGRLFLDVNNRHNAAAYGWWRVFGRRVVDALAFDERRGDASYVTTVGGEAIAGMGHLFTPAEVDVLLSAAGLRVVERLGVDYLTGRPAVSPRQGQLFYSLERT